MLRTFVGLALLTLLVLPAAGQDKTKKKPDVDADKDEAKAVSDSKKKLVTAGKVVGKITQVEGTSKNLTVQVTVKYQKPNLQAMQTMASLQAQLAQASQRRDFNQLASLQRQLAQQQPYTLADHNYKLELQAADDFKVRTFTLPLEYDDKGKPRQYTKKELAELKGPDPKVPGFTADFDNLRVGQEVEVTIVKPKAAPAKPKTKDKDRDIVAEDERLKATLILILRDPPPAK